MKREQLVETAATLTFNQAELLGQLLEERGEEFGAFPLSFAQQRLWFLDRLAPGEAAYNIAGAIEIRGFLDRAVLRRALDEIVRRHEVLRTVFLPLRGRPVQVATERIAVPLPEVDLTRLPAARLRAEREALARGEAGRPFELERGPLLRTLLLTEAAEEHALVAVFHHIVSDGWSSRLLAREIAVLYEAFLSGRPSPLPELPLQYADYALWQRERLHGEELGRLLGAVRPRLAGLPPLELPADHPRPAVQSLHGRRVPWALPGGVLSDLHGFCRREGVTIFVALTAAFAALLSRLSGQEDLAFGTPAANRDRVEIEPLIGCFVNTLVLRFDLSRDPGYRELVRQAKGVVLDAVALRDLPFERLVEGLDVGRSLSHAPLVQTMLVFQSGEHDLALPGLELRLTDIDNGTAKFDLTLSLVEERGGLRGWWEYSTDLFDAATIRRLGGHWERLLEGALGAPERPLTELGLLSSGQRQQVLVEWSDTGEAPWVGGLHEGFGAQAASRPEAVALVWGGERVSYGELERRAEGVAEGLRGLGVGPEVLVGVFLERGPWLVAGLLGILKAGGAYVPLDPAYPGERLAYMLTDSGARVVLTEERLTGRVPRVAVAKLRVEEVEGCSSGARSGGAVLPGQLAYVIYTSGSTGRPKGVAIEHRSAAALVGWAGEVFGREELSGVFASTSVCFDLSVFELFVPLSCGGAVVLGEDALALPGLGARGEVTLLNTVPSAMAELTRLEAVPESVGVVNLAGEPLRRTLVDRVGGLPGVARVLNLYGPSEDTTYSTWVEVPGPGGREPTIGRPVSGTRVRLLGPGLRPVLPGVTGELCLAGAGLARGYLGRPGRTAERFVPEAWGGEPGARLYRTGDRARHLAGGEVEFLGRLDQQVKLRGFRIELGEIETALGALAGVEESVVVVREERVEERRLVAYVTPRPGATPAPEELASALRERLPGFMVPSAFVVLAELPRTPNGKVDRKALPEPEGGVRSAGYVAPRGPAEELLAEVWAEVLGVERVGARDDFFALGGHSLLAVRALARIRDLFGVDPPVRLIFEHPELRSFAARLVELEGSAAGAPSGPIPKVERNGPLPLSFAQERLWFLDRVDPGSPTYNIPSAVRVIGALELGALGSALREVIRRHESLRTRFELRSGRPVQVIDGRTEPPLLQVDLRDLPGQRRGAEARRLLCAEALRSFDLTRGPLLRTTLLRLSGEEWLCLLTTHHIVSDAWSLGTLAEELSIHYTAYRESQPSTLPELEVQYADYAVWQRGSFAGPAVEAEVDWWRQQLAGAPARFELPTDRPRPLVAETRGGRERVELFGGLREELEGLARRVGATLYMTVLAGFAVLLSRYVGHDELLVGSPVSGRPRRELEGLIGFFVNTLTLRMDLHGEPSFQTLLERVREVTLSAMAHQELPFDKLVEELAPDRSLGHSPLFQVLFAFQAAPPALRPVKGLLQKREEVHSGTAKFDLSLELWLARGKLEGWLEYRRDLFDATTVRRMAGHLTTLLAAGAADPGMSVLRLPLLSAGEREQLLGDWSRSLRHWFSVKTVHGMIEEQVQRTPDKVAVAREGEVLSYRQLNESAEKLAQLLKELCRD